MRNSGIAALAALWRLEVDGNQAVLLQEAERHPQGVCRIRKAAEPPTAAQQRMIEAEANRIAALNAATPRYGQFNRQALQLFELLACNVNHSLGGFKGGHSLL